MKKLILIILIVISNFCYLYAQPIIEWQKCFGGTDIDVTNSIQQTNDGGYIVAGQTYSDDGDVTGKRGTNVFSDYWVIKINDIGTIQWQKTLGSTLGDWASSIIQTTDNGYIVVGFAGWNDGDVTGTHGGGDYWVVKLDSIGSLIWQKSYGGHDGEDAYSIIQTIDGGCIIAGTTMTQNNGDVTGNHGDFDFWIVKINPLGTLEWEKSLGGVSGESATSIQQTFDGGYIVAGWSGSSDGDVTLNYGMVDYWIVKLDSIGTIQWQKSYGGTNEDLPYSIKQTFDGGYIVAGYSYSNDSDVTGNHGKADYWILKLDSIGMIQWQKSLGGTNEDWAYAIQQTIDGGYIIAGLTLSNDGDVMGFHSSNDLWIIKLNNIGTIEWQKTLGGSLSDYDYSIQQTNDGGYILGGTSGSNDGDVTGNHGDRDFWIVKLSPFPVNVKEIQNSLNDFQVTPNPFSDETIISFQLLTTDKVNIVIRDIEGRVIKNIGTKNFSIGTNKILWDGTNNADNKVEAGIYFITTVSNNFIESKKVIVLRN